MAVSVKFCGAAGTVTGSCYWVRTGSSQFLIDCGMFQGSKTIKELNYGAFPFDPAQLDFVLLTHAHTDHAALVPKLVKHGFSGHIYATAGTRDLLSYMLPDSAYIQEMEVDRLNRRNRQRGKPTVEAIYSHADVAQCLGQIQTVEYDAWLDFGDIRVRFWNAGHILGAASIELELPDPEAENGTMRMVFSGDIGPDHKSFHPDPDAPQGVDYLFCESTYGGRVRQELAPDDRRQRLAKEVNDALKAGGALIIPAFAVERTQELLLDLSHLLRNGDIPRLPVFVDSPLAIRVTSVFSEHASDLEDMKGQKAPFHHSSFHFTETTEESKSIARFTSGVIIMAASGMCDAGRIRHHLKNHLWRSKSTILFIGYQAEGTLGWMLERGKKRVKIQGDEIEVKARIRTLDTYSGHADNDGLLEWVEERFPIKQSVFLTHGSPQALQAMHDGLVAKGVPSTKLIIPQIDDAYELLNTGANCLNHQAARRLDPKAVSGPDWHNELAQLTLDIRARLDTAPDDKTREAILKSIRTGLGNEVS